jgi:AraC-like DNA-binding protein
MPELTGTGTATQRCAIGGRIFATETTTVMAWVRQQRLAAAYGALTNGDLTVTQVASRSGYTDPAHFSRAFKRMYGIPPSTVRSPAAIGAATPTCGREVTYHTVLGLVVRSVLAGWLRRSLERHSVVARGEGYR